MTAYPGALRQEKERNDLSRRWSVVLLFALTLMSLIPEIASAEIVWLDDLYYGPAVPGPDSPRNTKSVNGRPLTIAGQIFQRGVGTHVGSLHLALGGRAKTITARVGVDDQGDKNPPRRLEFLVLGDERVLWRSGEMRAGDAAKPCAVDLAGVQNLELQVINIGEGIDYGHADWVEARLETVGSGPFVLREEAAPPEVAPYILTPPAPPTPRINGANVFGVRPGSPLLFTIPATGNRPMTFSAQGLPADLALDATTGHITGVIKTRGEFIVTLGAKNALGEAKKKLRIVCGDQIALTPPMGWNSWNCFASAVSEDHIKQAAEAMVKSGLINHGWTYINIDDYWQNHRQSKDPTLTGPFRDTNGIIRPNARFPDMKGLADYVHGLGLKVGLYSSPGPWTCGGCAGSFGHERQDAEAYARWGFDYLKYDWCSYGDFTDGCSPTDPKIQLWNHGRGNAGDSVAMPPYALMGGLLREQNRDIVFSLCQYGMSYVWKWGDAAKGNCWRTTCDITDTWKSMSGIGFNQDAAAPYAKPGNWNDPDMLVVGVVGWGNPHPSRLTPDEQYTHLSLWCLLSAPLLIGCDMTKLDAFTLNLLENDEVLAVDQDPLGKQATCVLSMGAVRVYAKPLEDGSVAAGFFNLDSAPVELQFTNFAALKLTGVQTVRDLWRQKNVAEINPGKDALPLAIPAHGVVLFKFTTTTRLVGQNGQ